MKRFPFIRLLPMRLDVPDPGKKQIKTTDVRIKNLLKTKADILYAIRKVKYDVEPEDNLMHEQESHPVPVPSKKI